MSRMRAAWLAADGAAVSVAARRTDRLEQTARQIREIGGTALVVPADLTGAAAAAEAVDTTTRTLGRLDTLVNAAGVMLNGPSEEALLGEWDRMVDINLRGLMYVTRAALPHLLASGGRHALGGGRRHRCDRGVAAGVHHAGSAVLGCRAGAYRE
ncbi:SDR family NAD(P)-dependent oxidoreductase [Winogradskya humida]|uniref:SDR family NAD(P)-dependent oxidoreductase n=1 Tax=Winogradskya humida TaxID=113566 RepID=UPI0031D96B05